MSDRDQPSGPDPLAEHDRPWHTHNAWDNHRQTDADETPLRDRPIMPHVTELAGEHRGERDTHDWGNADLEWGNAPYGWVNDKWGTTTAETGDLVDSTDNDGAGS
jgi:hypothetical protein